MSARIISNKSQIANCGYTLDGYCDDPDILEGGVVTISNLIHLDGKAVTLEMPKFELESHQVREIGKWFHIAMTRQLLDAPFCYYFNGSLIKTTPLTTPRVVQKPWKLQDISMN